MSPRAAKAPTEGWGKLERSAKRDLKDAGLEIRAQEIMGWFSECKKPRPSKFTGDDFNRPWD